MITRSREYDKMVSEVVWIEGLLQLAQHRKDAALIVRHDNLCAAIHAYERQDADAAALHALCDKLEGVR